MMNNIKGFVSEKECHQVTKLSRTTRYRMTLAGKFPPKYRISSGVCAYKYEDISAWFEGTSFQQTTRSGWTLNQAA